MSGEDEHKLFVAGLAETATEEGLRGLFEAAGGTVTEITVPRDRASGKARGFAFVSLGSDEQAQQARQQLDGSDFEGRQLSVRPFRADRGGAPVQRPALQRDAGRGFPPATRPSAPPRSETGRYDAGRPEAGRAEPGRADFNRDAPRGPVRSSQPPGGDDSTLYIGNLPFDCSVAELEELFREKGFDSVRRVHLPSDPEGRPRGFGFISLASAEDARRAVDELAECSVRGRRLSISVARARGTVGAPAGRPPRPPGATGGGGPAHSPPGSNFGGSYPPPHAAPRFNEPAAGFSPPQPGFSEGQGGEEARRAARWDKDKEPEKKKEKKRKVKAAPVVERGNKRRRDDGFRSTRAQDYVDDWDDD